MRVDAPAEAVFALDNDRGREHASCMRSRLSVGVLAALAIAVAACSDVRDATPSTLSETSVAVQPSTTPAAATATTATPTNSTTTIPAPAVITRPYIDPQVCGPGAKAVYVSDQATWVPFAVAPTQSGPLQVFASPTDGVAKPFAVVIRLSETSNRRVNDHPVTINGAQVSIDIVGNGNASAAWTLPDGTWAYLRARDLDEAAIVALVTRLTPRAMNASIPGFDLAPASAPDDLVLLAEHLNSGLSVTITRFQCTTAPNAGIYHVDAVMGDLVAVYFGVLDRPRPYVIAVNGTGAIAIDGPAERAITPAMVTNAETATWDTIRAIGPYGT